MRAGVIASMALASNGPGGSIHHGARTPGTGRTGCDTIGIREGSETEQDASLSVQKGECDCAAKR